MPQDQPPLQVALLGCGTVGSAVARLITEHGDDLAARIGRRIELAGIAVRRPQRARSLPGVPAELITGDADELVRRPGIDLVIEVIGGIEPARGLILAAMANGASVVTANKVLLAEDAGSLFAAAEEYGVDLYFEAAVAGAIPIVRPLRESLVGDEISTVIGIVNGTTNYILDKMDTVGSGFAETLAEAQELGFAEADPTADVDGFDAAAKAAILSSLAFHSRVRSADVHREGIAEVTSADIASAREMGCVVKMLAICELTDEPEPRVSARVHPAMIPLSHPLASVGDAYNAVFVETCSAGRLMFYGQGAGGAPTASAVLGDVVTVARNRVRGALGPGESNYASRGIAAMGDVVTRYHIRLEVADAPGVLATIAQCFARHGVSLQTVRQQTLAETAGGEKQLAEAQLVLVTHEATDQALQATVDTLRGLSEVAEVSSVMRVEGN
ncbi:homoserine dehydrogenase [Propionibacteriaceae bacterium Y2011]